MSNTEKLFNVFTLDGRLESFKYAKWPHYNSKKGLSLNRQFYKATPQAMANAGFFAKFIDGSTDNACCGYCRKNLDGWQPNDEPWEEHKSHSPTCPLANLSDPINRELTFTMGLWPHTKTISANQMAKAGFFFWPKSQDDSDDTAICVQCGLALDGWEPNDNPWHEHSRRRPKCPILVSGKLHAPGFCELMLASLPTENALRELNDDLKAQIEPSVHGKLLEHEEVDNQIKSLFQVTPSKSTVKTPLKLTKVESPTIHAVKEAEIKLVEKTPLRLSSVKATEKVEKTQSRKSIHRRNSSISQPVIQDVKKLESASETPNTTTNTPSMRLRKSDSKSAKEAKRQENESSSSKTESSTKKIDEPAPKISAETQNISEVPVSTVKRGRPPKKVGTQQHAIVAAPSFFAAPNAVVSSPKFKAPLIMNPALATPLKTKEPTTQRSTVKRLAAKRSGFSLDDETCLSARPSLGPVESFLNTPLSKRNKANNAAGIIQTAALPKIIDEKEQAAQRKSSTLLKLKELQIDSEDLKKSLGEFVQVLINKRMSSFDHLVTEKHSKLIVL